MTTTLDFRGLKCPLPVLKARKAMASAEDGTKFFVLVTDPAAPGDFQAFCDQSGHALISVDPDGEGHRITVTKKS